jgi:hypothetical protein
MTIERIFPLACYLIIINSDPEDPRVGNAQLFFIEKQSVINDFEST